MGIKHLKLIEKFLKESKQFEFSPSYLSKYHNIDYNTTILCLEYLWKDKKIILTKAGRYKWKK